MRTTTWIIAIIVGLALGGCGSGARSGSQPASTLQRVTETGVVRVGVKEDTRPFGYRMGGQLTGFDVDIANAVARQLGIDEVELVPVTSATRIGALERGEVDMVVASMTATRGRDRTIDFSIPYFADGQGLLVQQGSDIKSYLDLEGRLVGAVKGSTSSGNIATVAPGATVVEFSDYQKLEQAVLAGTVDAVTTDTVILVGMAAASDGALALAGKPFTTEPYGIGVPEDQSDWRDAINQALQTLWESGRYQLIYESWFGPGTPYADHVSFSLQTYPR